MADPLLTTLCSICHAVPPKYVCPGCAAATCSLPCSQRHKAWANCSGRRDPTAYMPRAKLKTAAGVDHDYNFLSGIERERDRNQRELVDDRGLFTERQLREMDEPRRWRRMWFGEEVHFVNRDDRRGGAAAGGGGGAIRSDGEGDGDGDHDDDEEDRKGGPGGGRRQKTSSLVRRVRQRLDHAAIEVVHMPAGMARQRENTTAWNRRAGRINWCVEWLVHDDVAPGAPPPTRVRHKALETTPLYRALGRSLAWHHPGRRQQQQQQHPHGPGDGDDREFSSSSDDDEDEALLSAPARRKRHALIREVKEAGRRTAPQDAGSGAWLATPYAAQNPYTAGWDVDRAAAVSSWLPDEAVEARRAHRFFLLRPLTPAGRPRELIPVRGEETLGQALAGRTVLEFPTVYVLPPPGEGEGEGDRLPDGCVLGSTERRQRQRRPRPEKRKAGAKDHHPAKRQALDGGGGGGGAAEVGTPTRAGARHHQHQQQRDRARGGGSRGRGGRGGGRLQHHQQQNQRKQQRRPREDSEAEEGEINSDGDEVVFPVAQGREPGPADTSSSDPDTSSDDDDEEEEAVDNRRGESGGAVDVDGVVPGVLEMMTTAAAASERKKTGLGPRLGLGLVDYGSDSSDDDDDDGRGSDDENDDLGDVDLAGLRPENPELVAGAIQEIVGLLS